MTALSVRGLTYTYPGAPRPALADVDLEVAPGEFVVLAGHSASGKSTLLRAAAGLVPHFDGGTFGGRVVVGGLDTREHGPSQVSAVAGFLGQDPETQAVLGTVRGELAFPLENRGFTPQAVARGVEEAALSLGVESLLDRQTPTLSGGELQRVALGAAVATRPALVVLDEPTSQLDPVAGDELVWLLRRLNEEWGTAVLLAEHRLERCLAHADRVVALDHGRVVCDAPPRDFLAWAAEHAPALQTPSARLLARAGLRPPPAGVRDARATLRSHGLLREGPAPLGDVVRHHDEQRRPDPSRGAAAPAVLRARGVWREHSKGRAVLRDVDLELHAGERVALMGRNGAGKSTLLRALAAVDRPDRGKVRAEGRVALLLQDPGAYLLHDTVAQEAPAAALERVGLAHLADRHPRTLSGGERQRLALAAVVGDRALGPGDVLLLDEPTRGMDRARKGELAAWVRDLGCAVLVATHDAELAAELCDRVVLLADGRPIADGPAPDVLAGGWYFATETARVLGGDGGCLLPEEGAALLRSRLTKEIPHP